jgi:hypothetical protein
MEGIKLLPTCYYFIYKLSTRKKGRERGDLSKKRGEGEI